MSKNVLDFVNLSRTVPVIRVQMNRMIPLSCTNHQNTRRGTLETIPVSILGQDHASAPQGKVTPVFVLNKSTTRREKDTLTLIPLPQSHPSSFAPRVFGHRFLTYSFDVDRAHETQINSIKPEHLVTAIIIDAGARSGFPQYRRILPLTLPDQVIIPEPLKLFILVCTIHIGQFEIITYDALVLSRMIAWSHVDS